MDQPSRLFLRDLALLLGVPALLLGGLITWWRPWTYRPHAIITYPYEVNESRARAEARRETTWHGLTLSVSEEYVILSQDSVVEVLELDPPRYGNGNWGSHIAFLPLTSTARERFDQRRENCSLAPGRCWDERAGRHQLRCQQAAGAPVPELWWTPMVFCEVQDLDLWVAVNAREMQRPAVWEFVRQVLKDAPRYDPGGSHTQ